MAHRKSKTAAKARRTEETHTEETLFAHEADTAEVTTQDGRATNLAGTSAWSREVYDANGYAVGVIVFALSAAAMWALAIAVAGGLVVIGGTYFVTMLPGIVVSSLSVDPAVLLASSDRFIFSWLLPVAFIAIVFAIAAGRGLSACFGKLAKKTATLRRGLYAGHGETWWQNRTRRKAEAGERAEAKRAKKAERARVRAQAAEAEAALQQ